MLKLCFFVPETHVETVKTAVFDAGAGKLGDYDQCAWQVLGQGQFRPLEGANPHLGQQGELESVAEYRVETLCPQDSIRSVIAALRLAHPYEEPAFDVIQLVDLESFD
jgi:hypothetical protein